MRPNRPRTELKISITRILTNLQWLSILALRVPRVKCQKNIQCRIGSIRQRGAAPVDTDRNTAHQVAHADREAGPEQGVARVVAVSRVCRLPLDRIQLGREDDGHDDAVDGDDFAEDDGD